MKLFGLILSLLGITFLLNAQEPNIRFQHLTPENGLSQGHVLCMLQDSEGYIWMGTYYGLNRYNGYTFTLFSKEKNKPKTVISDVIYTLFEDKDGYIWVGTVSGLDKFDKKTETFEHIPVGPNGLSDNYIHAITQDKKGDIWVATNNGGLNKIDYNTHKISNFNANKIGANRINDLYNDGYQNLWMATEGAGLVNMNLQNYSIKSYKNIDPSFNKITSIFSDKDGLIWIGNSEGKLASFDIHSQKFQIHNYLSESFKNRSISIKDIAQDINGNILVATIGAGLVSYNHRSHSSQISLHSIYDSQSISSNEVSSILVDRSWTVFAGTYGRGVSLFSPYNNKFSIHYIQTKNDVEGDINAYTSCVQDYREYLIIGTYSGFYVYNKKTWTYKHYLPGTSYAENKILTITLAPDSSIWMGTNRGIHQYDKDLNKIRTYNLIDNNLDHPVYCIYFDHLNNLWCGVFVVEGLFSIPESEWRNKSLKKFKYRLFKTDYNDSTTLFGDQIWSINQDANNKLWIGTNMGICRFNYEKENFTRFDITNLSKTIEFDKNNNMWIATRGEGVFYYEIKTGKIQHYTTEHGLSQNFVFGVIPANEKELWFTTENGLSRFNSTTEKFRNYDIFDGLPNNRFDDRSEKLLPNGEIYMGTAKGFTIFKPGDIKDDTCRARVVLTRLKISNKNIVYNFDLGNENKIELPIGQIRKIELLPNQKDFSVEFAALHYSAPHKIKFKYQLKGFDPQWINTDAKNRVARYTNLDGGKYTLYIMATNSDGVWNETPLKISIIVNPPFVKTIGFQSILIIFLGLLVFLFARWRINREHKQNITLAKMVKERTLEIFDKNTLLEKNALILNKANVLLEHKQKDIEDQKEELSKQRDKLIELNATKDKLFSVIAHDLKNPFNVIIGFSDLMIANYYKYEDDKRKKIVTQINQASRIAFQLLENLLDWSRSQKGNIVLNPCEIEISELIKTALYQVREFAKNKDIIIKTYKSEFNSTLVVDVNMMNTVFRNLLNNAIKFSHKGSTIQIITGLNEDNQVLISIKDQGIGMEPETCNNIFKLDKNVSNVGTAGEKGTGLGLLICKDFITAHQGKIWADSKLGQGTTFNILLPRIPSFKLNKSSV